MFGKTGSKYVSMGITPISYGAGDRMYTRKGFLTGGISLATMGGALGATHRANETKAALTTPNVAFKDLQTVKMLSGGGRDAMKKLGSRLKHDIVFLAHHGQDGVDKDFYAAVAPEAAIWPLPSWLWDNNSGGGPGSGPYTTNYTKCWMQDLGVKKNYVLLKDHLFI